MLLGVVSDIHGQPGALRRAIALMGDVSGILCLGDTISQTRFCNETVAIVREHATIAIRGNHEEAFFAGPGARGSGVDPALAEWLAARPADAATTIGGRTLRLVHSTPWPSGHAYVPPEHKDFGRFDTAGVDVMLYGHTHQPVVRRLGGTLVVNPGSLGEGRPTDAGFVRSFALLDLALLEARIVDLD